MKALIGGTPDRKTVIELPSASIKGGSLYSKVLLNFNVKFLGTSLMKKGGLLKNSTHKSLVVDS
jgi:hypothetical protein